MTNGRAFALTALAMLAFAGNSILCRLALKTTPIDAASLTSIRLVAGAMALWAIVRLRGSAIGGGWCSALSLLAYAGMFSFAYLHLSAATGALLLFAAVQATMVGAGLRRGERMNPTQWLGFIVAMAGLVVLLLPGLSAPSPLGAVLMAGAGVAWGVYSLRGRGAADPLGETAGNFIRSAPLTLLVLPFFPLVRLPVDGVIYAVLSGALTSGCGYAIWYAALRGLSATGAATVQLSVPVIVAAAGVLLLGEPLSPRMLFAAAAILGGIALVLRKH
ncbi:DMT family transporter [Jeongeupia naejangsanensis]|uniref:DMT family transporter n=1 Tax=Jeongeupia naejangsanensis TaxID=613195 RepID=A0ABS2BFT9_9NEIS|nr:DMT family transporter [Jeongeupia naejangsanensis]MBM3114325.1 DMT family transporter [Jeongeupia naejangsanensis]